MPTPQFTDDDYREILALRDRLRKFLHWSEEQAQVAGLTAAQHQLLLAVRGHPGPDLPKITDIAEHLQLRHHSAVGLIDRAALAGYVVRLSDENDGRVVRIDLTAAGRKALAELTACHITELRVLTKALAHIELPTAD